MVDADGLVEALQHRASLLRQRLPVERVLDLLIIQRLSLGRVGKKEAHVHALRPLELVHRRHGCSHLATMLPMAPWCTCIGSLPKQNLSLRPSDHEPDSS